MKLKPAPCALGKHINTQIQEGGLYQCIFASLLQYMGNKQKNSRINWSLKSPDIRIKQHSPSRNP